MTPTTSSPCKAIDETCRKMMRGLEDAERQALKGSRGVREAHSEKQDLSDHLASELVRWRARLQETWLARGAEPDPAMGLSQRGRQHDGLPQPEEPPVQTRDPQGQAALSPLSQPAGHPCFATLLLMSNTSISFISEQLGLKDPAVTVEHYARWLPGSNQAAMNVLPGDAGERLSVEVEPVY